MIVLETSQLTRAYGGVVAINKVDFSVESGLITGLIGPNGAGKTTVFNLITGVYKPDKGQIIFNGNNIAGLPPYNICKKGVARTFQNIRLFKDLSVIDNVKISFHKDVSYSFISTILRLPSFFHGEKDIEEKAMEYLRIFKLDSKRDEIASNLPYGEQRRLEIARALAAQPIMLILDEPAAGMNPYETRELMELIKWLKSDFKLTILLIEHDMSLVMGVCERIYVLDYGEIIAKGIPDEIRNDKRVIEAYLGEEVG